MFMLLVMGLAACEGPSGPEGEQGPEGPEGPVGPAGEDGSQMYADDGEPGDDIGDEGDFYLDQQTGELYGPKDSDGWGDPGVVLMGEDGADGEDGQDGADGQDGEDGSQIYSGSGEPDAELGVEGDFYLDEDNYELYGPKTSDGWSIPLNLKGADGNANVTRYLYPGNDFETDLGVRLEIQDYDTSTYFLVYLIETIGYLDEDGNLRTIRNRFLVPGYGSDEYYIVSDPYHVGQTYYSVAEREGDVIISVADGPGEEYSQIEIVFIEAENTEDLRNKAGDGDILPENLDVSNYDEVAEYYGFGDDQ